MRGRHTRPAAATWYIRTLVVWRWVALTTPRGLIPVGHTIRWPSVQRVVRVGTHEHIVVDSLGHHVLGIHWWSRCPGSVTMLVHLYYWSLGEVIGVVGEHFARVLYLIYLTYASVGVGVYFKALQNILGHLNYIVY